MLFYYHVIILRLLLSTMDTMNQALTEAQIRENEHKSFSLALQERLSHVRGEDLFLSLEERLREASSQLVESKAAVVILQNKLDEKVN